MSFTFDEYTNALRTYDSESVELRPMNGQIVDVGVKIVPEYPLSLDEARELLEELKRAIDAADKVNKMFGGYEFGNDLQLGCS